VSARPAEVLLADAWGRPGLAVARSLGRRGVTFAALGEEPGGMVAASRYVRRYVEAPSPREDPDGFVRAVLDTAARHGVRLVMPITDAALILCSRHRDALPRLAAAPATAVENVLDKRQNLETATRLGIPCPAEVRPEGRGGAAALAQRLGFPLVLKNPGFRPGEAKPALGFKWLVAHDEHELDELLDRHCGTGVLPVFQQLVEGTLVHVCCFAAAGKVVALHEYRSVRRLGREGTGVARLITPTTPRLAEYAERLLGELRWDGVAHVGFVVGEGDGEAWYMETNGRFWASIAGSTRAGWDFPYWAYRYFTAGELPSPPPVPVGSRTVWRWGDFRLLVKRLRGTEPPIGPRPGAVRALADYLSGYRPGVHTDVFSLGDPLPSLAEHWMGLKVAAARRLPG
jgi:predicted ATP-grasp superfamily ATP-dependent carboligase